ncbi:hypothetical protein [Halogeometricum luteum]|uniref:Uncharacterized protein n=1 Tax=Halogeometricum luteum TaxID=2950537 RepID=A0ABU2G511_9EURY|nr:hypothetical protein [Halogeometricum sp. S3BR5-2]MDS0295865.1 hypothetical protein [Halogeometricum sp. S3BR5-2]
MVSDTDSSPPADADDASRDDRTAVDPTSATTDGGSTAADPRDDPTYDVVYRATRDAMWDVVGTATLVLFYLALTGIGLSVAWTGLRFGIGPTAVAIGLVGLAVCLFSVYRVYVLATE